MSWEYIAKKFKMFMDLGQYNILEKALEAKILPKDLTKKAVNRAFLLGQEDVVKILLMHG